jgi:hypothetical protein
MRRALFSVVVSLPVLVALVALVATDARAQSNGAVAESLFREGKKLLEEKRFDEACPKFQESARLDLSSGVELALGLCLEGQGRYASAWGAYLSAATLAHHDGRSDREDAAKARASALEPKLSHVTIDVTTATSALAGLEVRQDNVVVRSPAWVNAPVDPGPHRLDVTAPGKKPFSRTYSIGAVGDSITVHVPVLEDLPPPPVAALPLVAPSLLENKRVDESSSGTWRKPFGFVLGGLGVAALGTGAVTGAITLSDASAVHKVCPSNPCSNPSTRSENQTAETLADASTGLFIAGGVALATGVVLVLTSPRRREGAGKTAWVRPVVGAGFGGLEGGW